MGAKVKEARTRKLIPNPWKVGEFVEPEECRDPSDDKIKYLMPNNWVFHNQIVKKVLEGDYTGIMPVCSEFVTSLNCTNRCKIPCGYELPKKLEGVWQKNNFIDTDCHMQDLDTAKDYLDKLADGGVRGLIFTGGGEPFLFRNLEELVAYATSREVDSVVYTNGNCVSEERIRKLVQASPLLVRVSLNAGTEAVYNEFHNPLNKKRAFQRTLRTIKALAHGSLENPEMSVGVGVVINQINKDDLVETALRIREIIDEAKGRIIFITYRPAFNYYDSEQLKPDLLDKTYEIVEREVRKVLDNTGVRVVNLRRRYEALKQNTRDYQECRTTGIFVELGPNGNLYLCCDRHLNRKYIIGNLESSLDEIWNSELRRMVLEYVNSNKCGICPPACKSHEINKQFQQVEDLRKQGKLDLVKAWIEAQQQMPKPKMANFP